MCKEILLLKTKLRNYNDIKGMSIILDSHSRIVRWNIDLDDCDKILRIESEGLTAEEVVSSLHKTGIWSEELLD